MIIAFHFTDDRRELSYEETLEMIESHEYLMDFVNDPEAHVEGGPVADRIRDSLLNPGGENADFFP